MSYDIVSFDLDGTLVDTAADIALAVNRTLGAYGIAERPVDEVALLIGNGSRQLMLRLLAQIYLERPVLADALRTDAVLLAFEQQLGETMGHASSAYPGTRAALESLKQAGVRLACVSNKEAFNAARVLKAARLDDLFELLVGGDSLPHKKPHASVLREVARALGGDTRRAAHVGDSAIDVQAARNAGVAAWAVPYGYNAGAPIADARPDRIFPGLPQVSEHVLAGRAASAVQRIA